MHKKVDLQYDNWTTPQAATELLESFYTKISYLNGVLISCWKLCSNAKQVKIDLEVN